MIKIEFLGPIAHQPLEMEASSLQDVANKLQEIDGVYEWLDRCAVAVNSELTNDLTKALKSGDIVSILPPVCGG